MAVKYVKDFAFDSGFGFTGSSGGTPVKSYMRSPMKKGMGGGVKAGPKAPSIAPAMVEKRSQGLGGLAEETKKLAAYDKPHTETKKGASVPMYDEGGAVIRERKSIMPVPRAPAPRSPLSRREVMGDRREAAREIMDRYIAGSRRAMPAPRRRAMPVAPAAAMIAPPSPAIYAKGGKVSKARAKVGKVMGEFKRGELRSGSKKGPVVTNPKQAKAIALSEARAASAKIPKKKAMGGIACD